MLSSEPESSDSRGFIKILYNVIRTLVTIAAQKLSIELSSFGTKKESFREDQSNLNPHCKPTCCPASHKLTVKKLQ